MNNLKSLLKFKRKSKKKDTQDNAPNDNESNSASS